MTAAADLLATHFFRFAILGWSAVAVARRRCWAARRARCFEARATLLLGGRQQVVDATFCRTSWHTVLLVDSTLLTHGYG